MFDYLHGLGGALGESWILASGAAAAVNGAAAGQWAIYGGDPAGMKFSALTQINRTNVQRLKPAWIFRCDDMRAQPASTIECNPLIIDGRMYLTTPGLKVLALEAASGRQIWAFDPWAGRGGRGVNRGVTYWSGAEGRRIFFVAGTFLYALDAADGRPVAGFGANGKIDLREGLD